MRSNSPPTQYLPNAIGDPKRRSGEAIIRRPVDVIVYAEGYVDRSLLELASSGHGIKVTLPPQREPYKGKQGILKLLGETQQNAYAVVDMDHDFSGFQIKEHPNVKDTRAKCCLLSYLLGDDSLVVAAGFLSRNLFPKDTEKAERFRKTFTENWPFLHMVAMERTAARMFRGKYRESRKVRLGGRGELPTLAKILSQKKKCIRDLISPTNDELYVEFKRKYAKNIKDAGANDHALEEVLIPFIAYFEPELSLRHIKHKYAKGVEKFLIYSKVYKRGAALLPFSS